MSHSRRRPPKVRIIALAAVCCFALFAFSASAVVQASDIPPGSAATTDAPSYQSDYIPPGSAATTDAPSYRSGDTPAGSAATTDAPSYRSGDTPATRAAVAPTSQVTTPSVTRTVVQNSSDHTLAIVLAGSALGIALLGSGFALLRTRMPKAAGLH